MSKIALASDPSGTGTFTIASPNSNTNRTLTLPDTSGEVFNQGNILGTVSQSSGVPTGAIIERGSNANGEFVKYADGTLICTMDASYSNITTAAGNIFRSATTTQTLPVAVATGTVSYTWVFDGGGTTIWGTARGTGTSAVDFTMFTSSSLSGARTARIGAVGRWY
jgi:hypothetical protein